MRDGIVIDKNFMASEEQRIPIGQHHNKLTLYYHLLPIHKTEQNKNVTPATSGTILSTPNYTADVIIIFNNSLSISQKMLLCIHPMFLTMKI